LKARKYISSKEEVVAYASGVTCDFCHTVRQFEGEQPGTHNYVSIPSYQKSSPYPSEYSEHYKFVTIQSKSEFCGMCHDSVNHNGLEVKATYTEWKNSKYSKEGVQCQDCHMTALEGSSTEMDSVEIGHHGKYSTHRFRGSHSTAQLKNSLSLSIEPSEETASAGDEITVQVLVDNGKTGHKFPTGSSDLRLVWIDINAHIGDKIIPLLISAKSTAAAYDVSGEGMKEQELLGDDIPPGRRLYRAIFVDGSGHQTFSAYDAVKIIYDNRLNASEARKETYRLKIPVDAKGSVSIIATLNYLPYPSSFAQQLKVEMPKAVTIASAKKTVTLH